MQTANGTNGSHAVEAGAGLRMRSQAKGNAADAERGRTGVATATTTAASTAAGAAGGEVVNAWQEVRNLWRFSVPFLRYPLENLSLVCSDIWLGLSRLRGVAFDPARDIQDQSGKVILVTGGNAGLGYETIKALAAHNPRRIYLAARSEAAAVEAITSIKLTLERDVDIRYLPLDLASLTSVRAAATQFEADCDRLDTLVLNAGVMNVSQGSVTEEGYEAHMGINYIGHWLLTDLLLPVLLRTARAARTASEASGSSEPADVRVVSVSSWAYMMAPVDLATLTSNDALLQANAWARYGASKAANVALAAELARQHPELTCVSLHPGIIPSNLYTRTVATNPLISAAWRARKYLLPSVQQGAHNQLWLAAGARKEELVNGGYYNPVGVLSRNWFADNDEVRRMLWKWAQQEVKKH